MAKPTFDWIVRGQVSQREFFKQRASIRDLFEESCGIGDEGFWTTFTSDFHIDRILFLYTHANDPQPSGFVAIKQGYRCQSDQDRPGYANCSYRNADTWYIELICANNADGVKGKGGWLLDEVKRAAQAQGVNYITLSALPYVVTYYYQKGFKVTMDPKCYEPQELSKLASTIRAHVASGAYAKKAKGDPLDAPFHDPKFVKFLTAAIARGFTQNRHMLEGRYVGQEQKRKLMNARDGIYMTLCLKNRTMEIEPTPPPLRRSARLAKPSQTGTGKL